MPSEVRAVYEKAMAVLADRDANGVPDILEGPSGGLWHAVKRIWGVAREARRSGIENIRLRPGPTERETGGKRRPGEAFGPLRRRPARKALPFAGRAGAPVDAAGTSPGKVLLVAIAIVVLVLILNLSASFTETNPARVRSSQRERAPRFGLTGTGRPA